MPSTRKKKRRPSVSRRLKIVMTVCLGLTLALVAGGMILVQQERIARGAAEAASFTPAPLPNAGPDRVRALWVGDSFTAGSPDAGSQRSYVALVGEELDWVNHVDAQGGTGFIADGKNNQEFHEPLINRHAANASQFDPDIVIVDAGRNDSVHDFEGEVVPAVTEYLTAVREAWPEAELVLVVPFQLAGGTIAEPWLEFYQAEAERLNATVLNPLAEGWLKEDYGQDFIFDATHPNVAGHAYLAEQMAPWFAALEVQPAES